MSTILDLDLAVDDELAAESDSTVTQNGLVVGDGGIRPGLRIPGVWANLMTFFGGPRSCMGMRFSLLEMSEFQCQCHFEDTILIDFNAQK